MKVWSVEAERGGFTVWEDMRAATAADARADYERLYPDAKVRAVSEGASKVAWFKGGVSVDDMLRHLRKSNS